jgi:MYXO-CTERM domain-containing protein
VLNFDDLPSGYLLTLQGYAGLNWEEGILGDEGSRGLWYAGGRYPSSPPRNVVNTGGSTLMGIGFPSPVDFEGAYFAEQGNLGATSVRVLGYQGVQFVAMTDWTPTLSATPVWLDMTALYNVNRILVQSLPVNAAQTSGPYGMDDLTFTYVPEPAGVTLGLLALGGLLLWRRRSR